MSSSNCCFLTCIQLSQEADQVVWYSHLLQNFPQFIVIHTVKGFGIVNKAEIEVFSELSCFFHDPADVGNLISGSSAFSKTSFWGPSNSLLSVWLPEEPLTVPHPCFVHGKRNGGINLSVLGAPCCFSLRAQGFSSKRTLGIASTSQNSRALHVDRPIQDTTTQREMKSHLFLEQKWNTGGDSKHRQH